MLSLRLKYFNLWSNYVLYENMFDTNMFNIQYQRYFLPLLKIFVSYNL